MKIYLRLTLLTFLLAGSLYGQFVTIPDPNFVTYLQQTYPTCMSGNQMDTTCAGIVSAGVVNVSNKGIADLTGIQYFDGLLLLNCSQNQLTSLPPLSPNLITLKAGDNQINPFPNVSSVLQILELYNNGLSVLPPLPNTLTSLYAGNNPFTSFPVFPPNLDQLDLQGCGLTTLPALPNSLTLLFCANNPLGTLPIMPPNLESLAAINCQLTSIPTLPNTLKYLSLDQNIIGSVPVFPTALEQFFCSNCSLTAIAPLPVALRYLYLDGNQLTSLPALPSTMQDLTCANNQLTSLPAIPSGMFRLVVPNNQITYIGPLPSNLPSTDFSNNQITCFAPFPQPNTINLNVTNNPFTCLPNYPNYMNPPVTNYTICAPGNAFGCLLGEGIGGTVYEDLNLDCSFNGIDPGLHSIPVKLYDGSGNFVQSTNTHLDGPYFLSQGFGTWTASVDTLGKPYQVNCSYPGIDSTVTLALGNSLVQNVNFELGCKPGFDLAALAVGINGLVFPGQTFLAQAYAGDASNFYGLHCAAGTAGQVVVNFSGPITYVGPSNGALSPIVAGQTLTYNIADFGLVNPAVDFGFLMDVLTTATITDTVCFDVMITPTSGDQNPANNAYSLCTPVRNSYDPNSKDVSPMQVGPNYADWLTYTVHFQNMGNAAAINIRVEDTLDANLDWSSLELLAASHYHTWNLTGNALAVYFPNIMLIDSTTDPIASQGYFIYRVKPKANLPLGTIIPNTAAIYFDFNAPVITNVATTSYNLLTARPEPTAADARISVYPNPSAGRFQVEFPADWKQVEWQLSNVLGQRLQQSTANAGSFVVDLSAQPAGCYYLELRRGQTHIVKRLLKE